jgi:hypothetical protein
LDAGAAGCDDPSVAGGVGTKVICTVWGNGVIPDDGVWAETTMTPEPTAHVLKERLVAPVLCTGSSREMRAVQLGKKMKDRLYRDMRRL